MITINLNVTDISIPQNLLHKLPNIVMYFGTEITDIMYIIFIYIL